MCLTNRLHRHKEYTVYSRHKGEWVGWWAGADGRRGPALVGERREHWTACLQAAVPASTPDPCLSSSTSIEQALCAWR